MPDKKPAAFDSEDDWIDYCMGDDGMQEEHPDEDDRYGHCKSLWDNRGDRTMAEKERRFLSLDRAGVQVEDREDGQPPKIIGLASVFYDGTPETEFELWSDTVERIMPGAFDRALEEKQDVLGLFNHDPDNILGRTTADTLALSSDKIGLRYSITPGDTQVAKDVTVHIQRGDLTGSSFSFVVLTEQWRKEDGVEIREIEDVDLFDVGPVTFPAYEGTTVSARAREALEIRMRVAQDTQRDAEDARRREFFAARWGILLGREAQHKDDE